MYACQCGHGVWATRWPDKTGNHSGDLMPTLVNEGEPASMGLFFSKSALVALSCTMTRGLPLLKLIPSLLNGLAQTQHQPFQSYEHVAPILLPRHC